MAKRQKRLEKDETHITASYRTIRNLPQPLHLGVQIHLLGKLDVQHELDEHEARQAAARVVADGPVLVDAPHAIRLAVPRLEGDGVDVLLEGVDEVGSRRGGGEGAGFCPESVFFLLLC